MTQFEKRYPTLQKYTNLLYNYELKCTGISLICNNKKTRQMSLSSIDYCINNCDCLSKNPPVFREISF